MWLHLYWGAREVYEYNSREDLSEVSSWVISLIRGSSFKHGDVPELISASGYHSAWEMPVSLGLNADAN